MKAVLCNYLSTFVYEVYLNPHTTSLRKSVGVFLPLCHSIFPVPVCTKYATQNNNRKA